MRIRITKFGYVFGVSFCFFSCKENISESNEKQIFRYNEHANISSLDPAFARNQSNIWAVNQIFSGLVQLNDSLDIQPDIAKKWVISEDGKQYSFFLRNDVFFHQNPCFPSKTRKVVASDFVFSFHRLKDDNIASSGKWILEHVEKFWAENDTILQIQLRRKLPAFLGLLATQYACVVPKEAIDFYKGEFRKNPVGTGAFKFQSWWENSKLILQKNELYYEKDIHGQSLPYLDAISITFLPEKQAEFLQFVQGKLDFVNAIDASYKDEILTSTGELQPKYQNQIKIIKSPFLNTEYLGIRMNKNNPISENEPLRKAIHLGIDRKKMIRYLRNNIGIPAFNGFIPRGLQGFSSQQIDYQPEISKKIVSEYIQKYQTIPSVTITTDANYIDICEYLQRELQNIGFECIIDLVPSSTLRQSRATGKLETFRASWIADYPDAENYLSLFYSKNWAPEGVNYTHFKNQTFDKWYEQALEEKNTQKRIVLYQKMDSLIMKHLPIIPLYYDENVRFIQKNIEGMTGNPINILHLKNVRKKN